MATPGFRLSGITIDCLDPYLVAPFWSGLLSVMTDPEENEFCLVKYFT